MSMIQYKKSSWNRVLYLFFIVASLYYWVCIPVIRLVLYFYSGRDSAESASLSLMFLQPLNVLFSEPEKRPSSWLAIFLYYIRPVSELLAFTFAFIVARIFLKKINSISGVVVILNLIFIVPILFALLNDDWKYFILTCIASLSGIGITKFASQPICKEASDK